MRHIVTVDAYIADIEYGIYTEHRRIQKTVRYNSRWASSLMCFAALLQWQTFRWRQKRHEEGWFRHRSAPTSGALSRCYKPDPARKPFQSHKSFHQTALYWLQRLCSDLVRLCSLSCQLELRWNSRGTHKEKTIKCFLN